MLVISDQLFYSHNTITAGALVPSVDAFLDTSFTELVATWSHMSIFYEEAANRASKVIDNWLHGK
jgi:hypothetical protein